MSTLTIIPIASEKAYDLSTRRVYTFKVPLTANKQQVKLSVQAQFGVTVLNVTSLVQQGKRKAYSKGKRARPGIRKRNDVKKAYVTLAEGDSIKVFDEQKPEDPSAAAQDRGDK